MVGDYAGKGRARLRAAVLRQFYLAPRQALLPQFSLRDWERNYSWLDASGLALYFYDLVTSQGMESSVPLKVLERLQRNLSDNQARTRRMFEEAVDINEAFRGHGLRYLNLKGFTLFPDFCLVPSLRNQFDLDFLMPLGEAAGCCEALSRLGYRVTGGSERMLEFKAGEDQPPSVDALYQPRPQRSVEVHFVPPGPDEKYGVSELSFERAGMRTWGGYDFASLSEAELFMAQAFHIFWHLQSEWTRASWLVELRNAVKAHYHHEDFWIALREASHATALAGTALAVALALGEIVFGDFAPRGLTEWTVNTLSARQRTWIERYGMRLLLSDFPGSKLYLLLQKELGLGRREERRRKLFPLHGPPSLVRRQTSTAANVRAVAAELRYWSLRIRFHALETARYAIEAQCWEKVAASSDQRRSFSESATTLPASPGVYGGRDS